MKSQEKLNPYSYRGLKHFEKFIKEFSLFKEEDDLLLAVSGGVDSVLLLELVIQLNRFGYSNELRVININHNTRKGQEDEKNLVEAKCKKHNIEFIGCVLQENITSDFENQARKARLKLFTEHRKKNEVVLTAHHIDDSFEWHLMQKFKSSNIKNSIGIPLINDFIKRPFMCFTKKQIYALAKELKVNYLEDPTNKDISYERNYVRNKIIPLIANQYPKYLKHYVNQSSDLVKKLNLYPKKSKTISGHLFLGSSFTQCFFKEVPGQEGINEYVLKSLHCLNPNSRGKLSLQIKKIHQAMLNNKIGPLSLTNGIKIYLQPNYFFMVKSDFETLKNLKKEEVNLSLDLFMEKIEINKNFPIFIKPLDQIGMRLISKVRNNKISELLTQKMRKDEKSGIVLTSKFLARWDNSKNRSKKLHLRLFWP